MDTFAPQTRFFRAADAIFLCRRRNFFEPQMRFFHKFYKKSQISGKITQRKESASILESGCDQISIHNNPSRRPVFPGETNSEHFFTKKVIMKKTALRGKKQKIGHLNVKSKLTATSRYQKLTLFL